MKSKLYILPSFGNANEKLSRSIYYSMNIHKFIFSKSRNQKFIPSPAYEQISAEQTEVLFEESRIYPEESVLHVMTEDASGLQYSELSASYQQYLDLLDNIRNLEGQENVYHSVISIKQNVMLSKTLKFLKSKSASSLPVFSIDIKDISLDGTHVKPMGSTSFWIEEIILLFSQLTDLNISIDRNRISFESLLFYKNGRLAYLTDFSILSHNQDNIGYDYLAKHNMKALSKLLNDFFSYYYAYESDPNPIFQDYNSIFSRIYQRIQDENEIPFYSFAQILLFIKGKDITNHTEEKVGVFLDIANIYTDMKNMRIDYNKLFSKLYGTKSSISIKDKFAVAFIPERGNTIANMLHEDKQQELLAHLKTHGFEIEMTANETAKAKVYIDGTPHDADDTRLIQRMKERFSHINSILLLGGDKDYYDTLVKFQEAGLKVKVISTHPDSTSTNIIDTFDHSYITEFWDCVIL
jgi:hypothetical protein